jgi:hypothetical protein
MKWILSTLGIYLVIAGLVKLSIALILREKEKRGEK